MKNCAFLSMDSLDGFECYDTLVFEHLQNLNWSVEEVSWKTVNPNWDQYDLVVIRSPWDYQQDAVRFLSVLDAIEHSSAHLANPLDIVNWNINKKYLLELESKGVEIVPTLWIDSLQSSDLENCFDKLNSSELLIKPCISAGAEDTFRLNRNNIAELSVKLLELFHKRECMLQPFMTSVIEEGEFSLFYFNNQYSHAIIKVPEDDDFRVQEEHGGKIKKVEPEPILKQLSEAVLSSIETKLLYARLDFVRSDSGFALMEAELIEPSLYFNFDDEAPKRFANVIDKEFG